MAHAVPLPFLPAVDRTVSRPAPEPRFDLDSLAVTGGVHDARDAVKCVLAGAHAVQVVSALMRHGPGYLTELIAETGKWIEANEWPSLSEMRGHMNLARCPDPASYERVNYSLILQGARS